MPISKGGWKDYGFDDSPPAREPSERTKKEMQEGKLQSMRNMYQEKRSHGLVGMPTHEPAYWLWVNLFMVTDTTRLELEAGAAQVALAAARLSGGAQGTR